ncbi:MerR family transcriptional regulator [Gryllotalpicola daejeonensis]|uniref:MerR family transcriptional regulator n=2 Tax=Gryllotalpicola daejeonensis TaxID=993087 RepID=A0ABP7ZIA6_9MICO
MLNLDMYSIGEFASIGRVTVRMLRHYDEIGLLRPARVDPFTGYRSYAAAQLTELSRIVELKGLGLKLDEITRVMCGAADAGETERMLASARLELARRVAADTAALARLDARLRQLRGENIMATAETISVEVRAIPAQRVATITRQAPGFGNENIGPVIGPIFPTVAGTLERAGVRRDGYGPAIALYAADEGGDGSGALVTAGFVVPDGTGAIDGVEVTELPGVEQAAVTVHRGEMTRIGESWEALVNWIQANGYELAGVCREVYWTPGDRPQSEWVTDLVQPVRRAATQ